jgi:transposase-like protein
MRDAVGMNGSTAAESKSQAADTKRRTWSAEEREVIVRASLKRGTTVSAVARVYGVQPWQIYEWRKKARQTAQQSKAVTLVPVQVADPDQADNREAKKSCSVVIEAATTRITITGLIDEAVVRTVLECLAG